MSSRRQGDHASRVLGYAWGRCSEPMTVHTLDRHIYRWNNGKTLLGIDILMHPKLSQIHCMHTALSDWRPAPGPILFLSSQDSHNLLFMHLSSPFSRYVSHLVQQTHRFTPTTQPRKDRAAACINRGSAGLGPHHPRTQGKRPPSSPKPSPGTLFSTFLGRVRAPMPPF